MPRGAAGVRQVRSGKRGNGWCVARCALWGTAWLALRMTRPCRAIVGIRGEPCGRRPVVPRHQGALAPA